MSRGPFARGNGVTTPSDNPLVRRWRQNKGEERPTRRRLFAAVAAVVAFGAVLWATVDRHTAHVGVPASFVSCTYGGYVAGRCGSIAVPEDPQRHGAGKIELHVAVLPATTQPASGALFYLEGGPGGAATDAAVEVNQLFAEVGRRRDIVMVDQRGTGGSAPLVCPDRRVRANAAAAVSIYLRRCFAQLHGEPELDTTSVAADDIEAVRRALGYKKIDLYGGSYGATLAQAYLRRYPHSVRSVVLDSASLPDVRVYDVSARNAERALDVQFARCARAPLCRRAYPHPRQQLTKLLARGPKRVTLQSGTILLRPDDVAWTVDSLSETADGAATIPYAIDAAARGDYTALGRAYVEDLGPDLDARARLATFWVILCSEPWAAFDPAATALDSAGSYLAAADVARARLFRRACLVVPKGRVPADAGTVEAESAPVLLLAGGADPLDPVANIRGWRDAFPNGRLVLVPGAGHGAIAFDCVQRLVARFVAAGSVRGLDTSCARRVPLPPFETG
jgi:pimeloyl-ACP methyl ester carboxylesterase